MVNTLIFFDEKCEYIAKATLIFCSENIDVFEYTLATIVNEFVINELVKLTMP